MSSDIRKLQSHMAMLHREMHMVCKFLHDRNEAVTTLNEEIGALILECDMLEAEIERMQRECQVLTRQVELIKADRDTLIAGLAPLLNYHEQEAEETAARLIAVLLLSTEEKQHAWQLIQRAARKADNVDTLAERLLSLLEGKEIKQLVDELAHAEGAWMSVASPLDIATLRTDLQMALDAMRASVAAGKRYKDRNQPPFLPSPEG